MLCDWSIVSRGSVVARGQLDEDQEQLERVDRADDQVVVGVLAVVEVEPAEPALVGQEGDDLLDVRALRVMAEVDQHLRALAELEAGQQRGAPVGQVGRVERGLEELVLDQQLLLGGQLGVDARRGSRASAGGARAGRPGPGSSCRRRATATARVEPSAVAISRHSSMCATAFSRTARVRVGDRAELVVGVLEEVRVDRADAQAARLDLRAQLVVVVDGVPREVEARRRGAVPVSRCTSAASSSFSYTSRGRPGCGKTPKRVPESAVAPRRGLDDELGQIKHGEIPWTGS